MKKTEVQYNSRQYYMHSANALAPEYYEEEIIYRPQKVRRAPAQPKLQPQVRVAPKKHFLAQVTPNIGKLLVVFAMGVVLVGQYAYINSLGYSITQAQNEQAIIAAENERLKQEYAALGNLEAIELYATVNLGMVRPEGNVAYLPARQSTNTAQTAQAETAPETDEGFLTTIKGILGSLF